MKRSERSLKLTAIIFSTLFIIVSVFPLSYMIGNSLKDDTQVFKLPPKIFPESANSVEIALDYSDFDGSNDELKALIEKDAIYSVFGLNDKIKDYNIYEIKYFAYFKGEPVFYTRAHKMKVRLELDYGIYRRRATKQSLVKDDRHINALEEIGYEYDMRGIDRNSESSFLVNDELSIDVTEIFADDYPVDGSILSISSSKKSSLMIENFLYYYKLPKYAYSANETISRYSFFIFFINTCIVIAWAIITQIILCSLTAYGISKLFKKKTADILLIFFLGTMMIPFVSILIPQFQMAKSLGLYDNYAALLLPHLIPYAYFVYLFKGFFDQLPRDLFEAARIDGASEFYVYLRMVLPLSKPIISLVALNTFLANWNDFFWAWMVTERQELWTLNVALYNLSRNSNIKPNFLMGLSIVTLVPVFIITIIMSEQIKQSIAGTGIKG